VAALLERRGSVSILYACHTGATRFNEVARAVGDVAPQTLALRLTQLEEAGLIARDVVATHPPRAEYTLTEDGRRLALVLEQLQKWSAARPPARAKVAGPSGTTTV
jgi:DNA-binding HxlR family transcriptional regulator